MLESVLTWEFTVKVMWAAATGLPEGALHTSDVLDTTFVKGQLTLPWPEAKEITGEPMNPVPVIVIAPPNVGGRVADETEGSGEMLLGM